MTAPRMSPEERHLDAARAWLKQLLADRKQAQSESTARSLASQFRRVELEAAAEARAAFPVDEIEALLRAGFVTEGGCDGTGSGIPEFAASCIGCRAVRVLKALGRWP